MKINLPSLQKKDSCSGCLIINIEEPFIFTDRMKGDLEDMIDKTTTRFWFRRLKDDSIYNSLKFFQFFKKYDVMVLNFQYCDIFCVSQVIYHLREKLCTIKLDECANGGTYKCGYDENIFLNLKYLQIHTCSDECSSFIIKYLKDCKIEHIDVQSKEKHDIQTVKALCELKHPKEISIALEFGLVSELCKHFSIVRVYCHKFMHFLDIKNEENGLHDNVNLKELSCPMLISSIANCRTKIERLDFSHNNFFERSIEEEYKNLKIFIKNNVHLKDIIIPSFDYTYKTQKYFHELLHEVYQHPTINYFGYAFGDDFSCSEKLKWFSNYYKFYKVLNKPNIRSSFHYLNLFGKIDELNMFDAVICYNNNKKRKFDQ